ncbi:MAG: hypothetical protein ACRC4G_01710 [Alphaproteobacteria bacterium]
MKQTNKIKAFLTVLATTTALSSGFAVKWADLTPEQRKDIIEGHGSSNPFGLWNEDTMTLDDFKTKLEQKLGALSDDDLRTILQGLGYASERNKDQSHKTKMREFFAGKLTENEMADLEEYLSGKAPAADAPPPSAAETLAELKKKNKNLIGMLKEKKNEVEFYNVVESIIPGLGDELKKAVYNLAYSEAFPYESIPIISSVLADQQEHPQPHSYPQDFTDTPPSYAEHVRGSGEAHETVGTKTHRTDLQQGSTNPAPTSTQAKENPIAKAYREAAARKQAVDSEKAKQASNPAPTSTPAKENPIAKAYREAAERKKAVDSEKAKQASTTPATVQAQKLSGRAMMEEKAQAQQLPQLTGSQKRSFVRILREIEAIDVNLSDGKNRHFIEDLEEHIKTATQNKVRQDQYLPYVQAFIETLNVGSQERTGAEKLITYLQEQPQVGEAQKEEQKQEASASESEEEQETFSNLIN